MDAEKNGGLPSFRESFQIWLKIALNSFGGPAGQIAVMHKYVVEEKKWLSENRFLHALNYCMLLPGPEAQQLVTYIGWLLHKTKGGLVVGVILNLGVWFSMHTLFGVVNDLKWGWASLSIPDVSSIHWSAAAIALAAFVFYFALKWNMLKTIGACAALGLLVYLLG